MYQKEIIYTALYKDGSRLGSAGFLKVENRDRSSSLYLKVKNIPHSIHGRFPVRFYNGAGWKEVDGITLQEGSGQWEESEPESLRQVRLQIALPGGYLIEGISREAQQKVQNQAESKRDLTKKDVATAGEREVVPAEERRTAAVEETRRSVGAEEERRAADAEGGKRSVDVEGGKRVAAVAEGIGGALAEEKDGVERIPIQRHKNTVAEPALPAGAGTMVSEELPLPMADEMQINGIKEDKWEQILDTYDQIHPYGDERIYVKLEPKDFVILQEKYQHLVNNSFLLHGFYNYRYVILGKENDYYLGVPGVFYDREKMVALMFGFEAFECQSREAKPGDFGYYLRKVEL